MLLFLISLTGVPPTAGFVAKFVVILSAVCAGHIPLAIRAVACSVVSAFFYLRVAVLKYMKGPLKEAPPRMLSRQENRRYQRIAQTMISGSKCRHLNRAGRGLGTSSEPSRLVRTVFATDPSDGRRIKSDNYVRSSGP
jgi:NADH:ubiquinone oxidoreductase subunit 5 (subunit L)/multisubunit Na+/H+ antiporter MnhA subunit